MSKHVECVLIWKGESSHWFTKNDRSKYKRKSRVHRFARAVLCPMRPTHARAHTRITIIVAVVTGLLALAVVLSVVLSVVAYLQRRPQTSKSKDKRPNVLYIPLPLRLQTLPRLQIPSYKNIVALESSNVSDILSAPPVPPGTLDLRSKCPPVYNQGYGDCTNQSACFLVEYFCTNVLRRPFKPSRWMQNFLVQRFQEGDVTGLMHVVAGMYGTAQSGTGKGGGSRMKNNIAALMMDGMVPEESFPYPTKEQQRTVSKALQGFRTQLETIGHPASQSPQDVREHLHKMQTFVNAYTSFMHSLRLPDPSLLAQVSRAKVTDYFAVDINNIDEVRRALKYKGPVAFGMRVPPWISNPTARTGVSIPKIVQHLEQKHATSLTPTDKRVLKHLPGFIDLYSEAVDAISNTNIQKKHVQRQMEELGMPMMMFDHMRHLSKPVREDLVRIQKMSPIPPEFRLSLTPEEKREKATLRYPHDLIRKYRDIIDSHSTNGYAFMSAVSKLQTSLGLNIEDSDPNATVAYFDKHPELKEAVEYFLDITSSGHAMAIVGFDDDQQVFIVRNSWGPDWGDDGYCYISYDYFTHQLPAILKAAPLTWVSDGVGVDGVHLAWVKKHKCLHLISCFSQPKRCFSREKEFSPLFLLHMKPALLVSKQTFRIHSQHTKKTIGYLAYHIPHSFWSRVQTSILFPHARNVVRFFFVKANCAWVWLIGISCKLEKVS